MDRMQIQTNKGSEISGGGKWLLPQEPNSLSPEKKAGNQHSGAADRSPEKNTSRTRGRGEGEREGELELGLGKRRGEP